MKAVAITLVALIICGFFVYEYTGRIITKRHQVGTFRWEIASDKSIALSDKLVLEGIELTLRANSQDPAAWQAIPLQDPTGRILRQGTNPNAGVVILSNRITAAQLYATLEMDTTNRIMEVILSRPK